MTSSFSIQNSYFHRPLSIRIFVPDGDPDGLRMVEKSNWTGISLKELQSASSDSEVELDD